MLLLLIFWFLLYHGLLLWLALRFKTKSWRWYWFGAVLSIGLTVAWFDQFYVRYVVIGHYCEMGRDTLGFHEYEPSVVTADKVTWLWQWGGAVPIYEGQPRTHPGIQRKTLVQDGYQVKTDNFFICQKANGETFACLVDDYLKVKKYKEIKFLGVHFASQNIYQLMRGDAVIRQVANYGWSGSKFFNLLTKLNIPILYGEEICGIDGNEVSDIGSKINFRLKVVE